jgi:lipid-A-disaccharide synthase
MMLAGMEVVVHYRELAFMGFTEVVANLFTIARKLRQCKEDILEFKPDVIVLIDYAGFNLRIARFAKSQGLKVFWYISPKVWAWNQQRALKLKANIDRMFVILPFEQEFFKQYQWAVDYVGNPVLDAVKNHCTDPDFLNRHNLDRTKPLIALLPGSRVQEVKRIIPEMASVVSRFPMYQFVVAMVDNLPTGLYDPLRQFDHVKMVVGNTYDLLAHAHAAVVTSGTATLETALFKVPQVVVYRAGRISYAIGKAVIKVKFISLVNLIAGKKVVQELIQDESNAVAIGDELGRMMTDNQYRSQMLAGYDQIIKLLDTGSASKNTAERMLAYLLPTKK